MNLRNDVLTTCFTNFSTHQWSEAWDLTSMGSVYIPAMSSFVWTSGPGKMSFPVDTVSFWFTQFGVKNTCDHACERFLLSDLACKFNRFYHDSEVFFREQILSPSQNNHASYRTVIFLECGWVNSGRSKGILRSNMLIALVRRTIMLNFGFEHSRQTRERTDGLWPAWATRTSFRALAWLCKGSWRITSEN